MFSFVGCRANDKGYSSAEGVITEYINTYYTITKDDIELYKKITAGYKNIQDLVSDTNKANERFKNLMTDSAYAKITGNLMTYRRCKEASDNGYYVEVKSVKLEKYFENAEREVYYYYIELVQTSISGNEVKNIKDRKQITVTKINGNWKVSNSYANGY